MNETRFALRVGLFMAIGLIVTAGLLVIFSKGLHFFKPTYELRLHSASAGGLKNRAPVLLNGVSVGNIARTEVAPDGRGVVIIARIDKKYTIHEDAHFSIEQIGFLGDQYITIYQQEAKGRILENGAEVRVEEPLSIEKTIRSVGGLLDRADQTMQILNQAMTRVDRTLLSEQTLTNLVGTLGNFHQVSEKASVMADQVNQLIEANGPGLSISLSNMVRFSEQLNQLTAQMNQAVVTNRIELTKAVKSLEVSALALQGLMKDVEAGKGLVGSVFKDERLKAHVLALASNFETLSSNLTKYGLLYRPKQPRTNTVTQPLYRGNNPFSR
jgi:phospholipid/cholesterol/gamma-HCH transport system substrate-binding protein